MNVDASKCWDGSMLFASVNDAIKGMQLVEKESDKAKEQKNQILNTGVEKELKDEKRLLNIKA